MDTVFNAPDSENNVVDGINATDKHHLKELMKIIGKLASNNTSHIGILSRALKIHLS